MKTLTMTLAGLLLVASPALAMTADAAIDTDGDGVYSLTELAVAYPELTDEMFTAIDANADGAVDMDEFQAAQDSALLPATDG